MAWEQIREHEEARNAWNSKHEDHGYNIQEDVSCSPVIGVMLVLATLAIACGILAFTTRVHRIDRTLSPVTLDVTKS